MFNKKSSIVLIIIILILAGIVTALLVQSSKDKALKVAWQGVYTQLANTTKQMVKDNGKDLKGVCDSGTIANNSICIKNKYLKYLHEQDKSINPKDLPVYSYLNGQPFDYVDKETQGKGASTFLKNGMILTFYRLDYLNGQIWVDINGINPPNKVGKDYFRLWLYPIYVCPTGGPTDKYKYTAASTCSHSSYGWGCSFKYLKELKVKNLK